MAVVEASCQSITCAVRGWLISRHSRNMFKIGRLIEVVTFEKIHISNFPPEIGDFPISWKVSTGKFQV
jgi:hypothetical protein